MTGADAGAIHATAVATQIAGDWRGVLLTGASGSGKSDLALRLFGEGWRLIGDDYVHVWRSGGAVFATAPDQIAGRIEARGLGIVAIPSRWISRIALVVACGQVPPERLPEPDHVEIAGLRLPCLTLDIRPASATRTRAMALSSGVRQV